MRILVIAPHPDDELIGVGGTIAKHSKIGDYTAVCIVTKGYPPTFNIYEIEKGIREDTEASRRLGVSEIIRCGLPANGLAAIEQEKINNILFEIIERIEPDEVYIPFNGDIHIDHRIVAESAMVALRPKGKNKVLRIYSYEVPSETGWSLPRTQYAFIPNVYVDISKEIECKAEALNIFESQIPKEFEARSLEAIIALAKYRGSTVGMDYAEAFQLERELKFD